MTLAPVWRTRLVTAGAAMVAIWMGSVIAQEQLAWPVLFAGALAGIMIISAQSLPLTTVMLGLAICGYVIGNRGFAQLSLSDRLPLFPAELVLAISVAILTTQSALRQQLPWRRDVLNYAVLIWIAAGSSRLALDVRAYGFAALRDFALVYYAMFFFVAQHVAESAASSRFLHRCLAVSCVVMMVLQAVFERAPDFFINTLTVRGTPIIFYKGDLIGTFMAVGAVLFFVGYERKRHWWKLVLSLALAAGTLTANNRASMVGLVVATLFLAFGGYWRFAVMQAASGAVVALALLTTAYLGNKPWEQTVLHNAYERAISLVDPFGQYNYSGEITFNKGDNNRFRSVWWKAVFEETMDNNPWIGLGFGYDLAARFTRQYYPDGDEFTARSPHNVLLTIFGRMGALGLVTFAVILLVMAVRTMVAVRRGPTLETSFWCMAWVIIPSSCFGVVLEGPMGAVVFWIVVGTANALRAADRESQISDRAGLPKLASEPIPALAP